MCVCVGVSVCVCVFETVTRNHEVGGLIPGLAQWVKDLCVLLIAVSCGV